MTPLKRYPNFGTVRVTPPNGFPQNIAASGSWNSDLISGGYGGVIAGVTSTQAGAVSIQRYADLAGLIPVGPLSTQALASDTAAWTGFADGLPYVCFAVTITNTADAEAAISNVAILTGPLL